MSAAAVIRNSDDGMALFRDCLQRRIEKQLKAFFRTAYAADLQTMERLLTAYERRCNNDGESLNLAIFDLLLEK